MYNYLLNVSAANRKVVLDNELVKDISLACEEANTSPNSLRYGRHFTFVDRIDDYSVQIRLRSETAIIASRTISSISRALIRIYQGKDQLEKLEMLKYNGCLLNATVVDESEESAETYTNIEPYEIVQAVIEIFFGQTALGNNDKKIAKKAAAQIKDIVSEYKASLRKV